LDGSTSFDIQKDLEILTLIVTNITKITKFHHLNIWSQSDCIDLMNWHVKHERHFRRGVNNNLSLYNYDISEGETTYSLLNFRIDLFVPSVMVICPFKSYKDVRGIIRLSASFHSLKADSRLFDRNGNELLGVERDNTINLLVDRIVNGMNWNQQTCHKNMIRRYRLVKLLENSKCTLTSDLDCHHVTGHSNHLSEHIIDDTSKNIKIMSKDSHSQLHYDMDDENFVDYRLL
jgi:hypothetical protein